MWTGDGGQEDGRDADNRQDDECAADEVFVALLVSSVYVARSNDERGQQYRRYDGGSRRKIIGAHQFGLIQLRPCGCGCPGKRSSQLSSHIRSCH